MITRKLQVLFKELANPDSLFPEMVTNYLIEQKDTETLQVIMLTLIEQKSKENMRLPHEVIDNAERYEALYDSIVNALFEVIDDEKDSYTILVYIEQLIRIGENELALKACHQKINDKKEYTRKMLCDLLGKLEDTKALPVLQDIMHNDLFGDVQQKALDAINRIHAVHQSYPVEIPQNFLVWFWRYMSATENTEREKALTELAKHGQSVKPLLVNLQKTIDTYEDNAKVSKLIKALSEN